jgi:hypothetical protein
MAKEGGGTMGFTLADPIKHKIAARETWTSSRDLTKQTLPLEPFGDSYITCFFVLYIYIYIYCA